MSQKPRGKSDNLRKGPPRQNAPAAAAQAAPNLADPNAFGPPLGARARPNRQGGK